MARQKDLAGFQESNRLHRVTRNRAWLGAILHRLNGKEISWEEIRDNLRLRYGIMSQDIPATCNGCSRNFSIKQHLSFPNFFLVMEQHDGAEKEWVVLGSWDLTPSAV